MRTRFTLSAVSITVLIAGIATAFSAGAYAAAGDLDTSFGVNGKVTTDIGGVDQIIAMVVQPDGKLVAAGGIGESGFILARYLPNGSLDSTFGTGGRVVTSGNTQLAFAVALQSDGKIVAVGGNHFSTARYNTDGSLDTTFGNNGVIFAAFGGFDGARSVAIQGDGKILVGGAAGGPDNYHAVIVRYLPDGNPDPAFGVDGVITSAVGGLGGLLVQSDGKILSGGFPGTNDFAVARFLTDGSPDPTFGTMGVVTSDFTGGGHNEAEALALQPDGKIVVVGRVDRAEPDFAVARYNTDGSLDTTFGTGGSTLTDIANTDDGSGGVDVGVSSLIPSPSNDVSGVPLALIRKT
jgi:uncharacterized delta-60 repeat protein